MERVTGFQENVVNLVLGDGGGLRHCHDVSLPISSMILRLSEHCRRIP
jgi:hypothetical protein